jgi:hypothetical protein
MRATDPTSVHERTVTGRAAASWMDIGANWEPLMKFARSLSSASAANGPGELALRGAGVLRPPNLVVLSRNLIAVSKARVAPVPPWHDHLSRAPDMITQARANALAWLSRSQDVVGTGGVGSFGFSGWSRGYPEVTGYIIPTIWDFVSDGDKVDPRLADRAVRMANWELTIQTDVGGWEGGIAGDGLPPIVFNTGQVLRGLIRTYEETGEEKYLTSAMLAADWIVSTQEPDGSWERVNHLQLKRVYDTYVAAPLTALAAITDTERYQEAAIRNCEFAMTKRHENGWFDLCDNSADGNDAPSTHTICYTIDGLLEVGWRLQRADFTEAAIESAEMLARQVEPHGYLAGRFSESWEARVNWSCLTGVAQLGIVLGRLVERYGRGEHLATMRRLADFLVWVQDLNGKGVDRRGALAGSFPIWGTYAPLRYPCWATKYLLDFLRSLSRLAEEVPMVPALTQRKPV